jgi:IMP dehydrogenase
MLTVPSPKVVRSPAVKATACDAPVAVKDLVTVPDSIEPREAFEFLNNQRRKLAPVVDKSGNLVGILTRTAALRATLYQPAIDANKKLQLGT